MIPPTDDPVSWVAFGVLLLLSFAVLLSFVRLVAGPSLPDRVVALDVIAILMVGMIAVYSVATSEPIFIRVALAVALINFLGTIAFAYYLHKRVEP